jgi:chemotaxis protein CheX
MDPAFIIPFVNSVQKVFSTMLQLPVGVGTPAIKSPGEPAHDVSGIIGMSGDVEGAVVLSFPIATAERVVRLFTGAPLSHTHEDFSDAVGELINMVSGSAKAQFTGKTVSISCPSVIIGRDHTVLGSKDVTTIVIPCNCDCGEFAVVVSIRQAKAAIAIAG